MTGAPRSFTEFMFLWAVAFVFLLVPLQVWFVPMWKLVPNSAEWYLVDFMSFVGSALLAGVLTVCVLVSFDRRPAKYDGPDWEPPLDDPADQFPDYDPYKEQERDCL